VADLWRLHFGGLMAWLVWIFVHIFFLIGFRNRIIVLIEWAYAYFTYHRGARLITWSWSGGGRRRTGMTGEFPLPVAVAPPE
jgi:hypothetical protein